jgi:hypothetical protein
VFQILHFLTNMWFPDSFLPSSWVCIGISFWSNLHFPNELVVLNLLCVYQTFVLLLWRKDHFLTGQFSCSSLCTVTINSCYTYYLKTFSAVPWVVFLL